MDILDPLPVLPGTLALTAMTTTPNVSPVREQEQPRPLQPPQPLPALELVVHPPLLLLVILSQV